MSVTEETPAAIICSFCLRPTSEVNKMVAGHGVFICDACVSICVELVDPKNASSPGFFGWDDQLTDDALLAGLPQIAAAGAQVDRQLAKSVALARARGITWTRIGAALGTTRQSAWERFSGEE